MKNKNYLLSETFINNAVNYIASLCENDDGNGDGKEIGIYGGAGEFWFDISKEELTEKLKSFKKVSELEDYIQNDLGWEYVCDFTEFVEEVEENSSECEVAL